MTFAQCSADYLFYDVQNILTVQYYTLLQKKRPEICLFSTYSIILYCKQNKRAH